MSTPYHILVGGISSLLGVVIATILDFFKREQKYRYNVLSRADSLRYFYLFLGLTILGWAIIGLMQYGSVPAIIGWPIFLALFGVRIALVILDFRRRRMDVPNLMLRVTQYEFVLVAVGLVVISYYIHRKPIPTTRTSL